MSLKVAISQLHYVGLHKTVPAANLHRPKWNFEAPPPGQRHRTASMDLVRRAFIWDTFCCLA
jgi:hypothetical protein